MNPRTDTNSVQWLLVSWAHWRKTSAWDAKGYPHQTPFRALLGGSISSVMIDDEQAEKVDKAVCRVVERCHDMGEVLVLYYLEGKTVSWIARRVKKSSERTRRLLAQGETAVDYILNP